MNWKEDEQFVEWWRNWRPGASEEPLSLQEIAYSAWLASREAAQQSVQRTDCQHAETFEEDGYVCCMSCGDRLHEAISR